MNASGGSVTGQQTSEGTTIVPDSAAPKMPKDYGYEEVPVHGSGKRCGVQWDPWMGDWFNSWSPRNGNSNAEGPWDHWIDLALGILSDPMTKIVRPEAYIERDQAGIKDFYSEADRTLTDEELAARFAENTPDA